ncbi:MAG: tetratricopeptide repeat protein, partial [Deltaproteobacteria bacterium]|nr:tetratricopeptide repeat protein [Deltaproteobacteria bacterium]
MDSTRLITVAILCALVGCKDKPEAPAPTEPGAGPVEEASPAAPAEVPSAAPSAKAGEPAAPEGPKLLPLGRPDARIKVQPPAQVKYNQAKKAQKAKDRPRAIELLDESLEADPSFSWAVLLRARLHLQDGEKKECSALLERLLADNYVHFAPRIKRLAWLKPLRSDEEAWGPFEERMELYREAWVEALSGPGVFFIQSQFRKIEGTDVDGEPLDLRWARGVPVFWSKSLGRTLVIGEHTDVAGFLVDRENNALVLIRWKPHEEGASGLMGKVLAHRIDLLEAASAPRSIEIAAEAEVIRAALDGEGNLLFTSMTVDEEEALDELEETVEDDVEEDDEDEGADEQEGDDEE